MARTANWIRAKRRLAILLRDDFTCAYCARDLRNAAAGECTLDHVKCVSKGGGNESSNLVCACRNCNSSRQDKPLRTWLRQTGRDGATIVRIVENRRRRVMAPHLAEAQRLIEGE